MLKIKKPLLISIISISYLLLFVKPIFSEEPQVYPKSGIMQFRGLDNKSSPTAVQDGRATDLLNVEFSLTYGLRKRQGYEPVYDILDLADIDFQALTGIYYTKFSDGTEARIATIGTRFYYDNSGKWTLKSAGDFTAGKNNQFVWTTALDTIVGTNDTDVPQEIDKNFILSDLDVSDLTDILTKAKCVIWWKNYLIFGNTVENSIERPTRIRWSNVGYTETWTDDDYQDIAELGGQEIEAFGILYDNLFIFLTDSIYKVSLVGGDDLILATKVSEDIGCIAKNSVQTITLANGQRGLVFLSKDKTINFTNGSGVVPLSTLIDGTMNDLRASRLQYAVSAYDGDNVIWGVTTGNSNTTNNLCLVFNTDIGEWTLWDQIDANALAKVINSDGLEAIWFGNHDSLVYELDATTDFNDVDGATGTLEAVNNINTTTASGLQILYDDTASFTTSGAIVRIISGTGSGQERVVVGFTTTGLVVDSAFTTTPDATSVYSMGDIDAYYTTKWYDCGLPARRKQIGELFVWADEKGDISMNVAHANDFSTSFTSQTMSLLSSGGDVFGTGVFGTAVFGGQDAVFNRIKMETTGRYLRFKFEEDDVDEGFELFGYQLIYWDRDVF